MTVLRGEPWEESVLWAALGTLLLSGFEVGARARPTGARSSHITSKEKQS